MSRHKQSAAADLEAGHLINRGHIFDAYYRHKGMLEDRIFRIVWKMRLGKLGRNSYLKSGVKVAGNPHRISIGDNFVVWHKCFFAVGNGKIIFGHNGLIGVNSYINASSNNVIIGNNVAIAPFCQVYSYSHHYIPGQSIVDSHKSGDVVIEDEVLIGSNVIILPGVTIHRGAVVGAGSVVTNDIPDYAIAFGIPARVQKYRDAVSPAN